MSLTAGELRAIFAKNLNDLVGDHRQADIAKDIGISPSVFSSWCTGARMPRIDKLDLLADYFGVTRAFLVEDGTSGQKHMTIGERIKEKRLECGFTLEELAEKVGVQAAAIHKYETGIVTNIPLDRLDKIAGALDCSAAFLFLGKEPTAPTYDEKTQRIISMVEKMTEAQKDALLNLFAPSDD